MPRRKRQYTGPYKIPDSDEEFPSLELAERALDRRQLERQQAERKLDWDTGRQLERKDAEIMWLKSSLVTLSTLAKSDNSPLTLDQVAVICDRALARYSPPTDTGSVT